MNKITLDDIIIKVLKKANSPISVKKIWQEIYSNDLWRRPIDNQLPQVEQISARVSNYKNKFLRRNGLVYLINPGNSNEKRVARICWNDNGWIMPSGKEGKSKFGKSHEAKYGYGHEEWLLDNGKLIDGYHYGFLEPIFKQKQAFENKTYDVWLYTINAYTKKRYWVGEIKNVEVLDKPTSDKIKKEYEKRGWFSEMEHQIKDHTKSKGFSSYKSVDIFNIRFKRIDLNFRDYIELPSNHPIINQPRYTFIHFKPEFNFRDLEQDDDFKVGNALNSNKESYKGKKKYFRQPQVIEVSDLHENIAIGLENYLKKQYGNATVFRENYAGYDGNRIDIVRKENNDNIFYEIKTYNNLKTSIRMALGQIIEYSHWPDKNKAKKLVIITQPQSNTSKAITYIKYLRSKYNLPVYFQTFDHETNTLIDLA